MNPGQADHSRQPPQVLIPQEYKAAIDLLQRNAKRPGKVAFVDAASGLQLSYCELAIQSQSRVLH